MQNNRIIFVIAGLLFCCAMFVYSGRVLGIDGRGIIATTENFVKHQSWDMNTISGQHWVAPPPGGQGVWNDNLDIYSKKPPLTAILHIPLAWLGAIVSVTELVPVALLTIPIIYALTAILFFHVAKLWGIEHNLALIGTIWWGLGTYALANTIEAFAEPIMALGVLALFYAYLMPYRLAYRAFVAGCAAVLVAGGNLASAPITLIVLLPLIFVKTTWRERFTASLACAIPIGILICTVAYFNFLRSGNPLVSGYYFGSGEGFTVPMIEGLFGLLLGGYRGLIWYAPIVIISIFGYWRTRHEKSSHLMLLVIVAQVLIYSTWWAWHGGGAWGPRFLLPVLPLCVLLALPALEWLWQSYFTTRVFVGLLAIVSVYLQIVGNFAHYIFYEIDLYARYPDGLSRLAFLNPLESPIIGHLQYISSDNAWAVWLVHGQWWLGVLLVLCIILQSILVLSVYRNKFTKFALTLSFIIALFSAGLVSLYASSLLDNDSTIETYFAENLHANDHLLLNNNSYWQYIHVDNRPSMHSIPYDIQTDDSIADALVTNVMNDTSRQWYVTSSPTANWIEARIWGFAYVGQVNNLENSRILSFRNYADDIDRTPLDVAFDSISLLDYGNVQLETDILLSLTWQGTFPDNASLFIHLLNEQNDIIDQHDRLPVNGLLRAEGGLVDNHLFTVSDDLLEQTFSIRIGWVDEAGQLISPAGVDTNDDFLLLPILP